MSLYESNVPPLSRFSALAVTGQKLLYIFWLDADAFSHCCLAAMPQSFITVTSVPPQVAEQRRPCGLEAKRLPEHALHNGHSN